jgi:hypothetical protein
VGMEREGAPLSPDCVPALDIVLRAETRSENVESLPNMLEHCRRLEGRETTYSCNSATPALLTHRNGKTSGTCREWGCTDLNSCHSPSVLHLRDRCAPTAHALASINTLPGAAPSGHRKPLLRIVVAPLFVADLPASVALSVQSL